MTSEIAIANRLAIALAADSAASLPNGKIFEANKLFSVSKHYPVGAMVYQSSVLGSIPWETLFKVFKQRQGKKSYPTLKEYADKFIDFLNTLNLHDYAGHDLNIREILFPLVDAAFTDYLLNANDFHQRIEKSLNDLTTQTSLIVKAPAASTVVARYAAVFQQLADDITAFIPNPNHQLTHPYVAITFTAAQLTKFFDFCTQVLVRRVQASNRSYTGVVFAGFGENQLTPSLYTFHVEGFVVDRLRIVDEVETSDIGSGKQGCSNSVVHAFAERDMTMTFLKDIHPVLFQAAVDAASTGFDKLGAQIIDMVEKKNLAGFAAVKNLLVQEVATKAAEVSVNYANELTRYSKEQASDKILAMINHLSPPELAKMAMAMIQLTSLKMRTSEEHETVGGPVDVAIITKGDGLIWVERKHYFNPELNLQFVQNYIKS